jgi:hypothetical protein
MFNACAIAASSAENGSVTLGARAEQNPFSAELAAMAHALNMVVGVKDYRIGAPQFSHQLVQLVDEFLN